jgi:hypothetical protein
MMTWYKYLQLRMLQLPIISLNCYNDGLDSSSCEPHGLSLESLFVGNYNSDPNYTEITV